MLFSLWKIKKYPIRIQNGKCSLIFPQESFSIPLPLQFYPCLRFFRHSADLGPRMLIFCPWRGQTVDSLSPHLYPVSVFMLWKQCVLLWALKCYFSMQIVGLLCISHTLTNKCLLFSRNLFPPWHCGSVPCKVGRRDSSQMAWFWTFLVDRSYGCPNVPSYLVWFVRAGLPGGGWAACCSSSAPRIAYT